MTIRLEADAIVIAGKCGAEEADSLVEALNSRRDLPVDLRLAEQLHTALWQALLMAQPAIIGEPLDAFSARHILPAMIDFRKEVPPLV